MAYSTQSGIMGLVASAIGVLMLVITFVIVPMIGYSMDDSITIGADSQWNASVNSDIKTGYSLWGDLAPIISVTALVMIVSGIFVAFKSFKTN